MLVCLLVLFGVWEGVVFALYVSLGFVLFFVAFCFCLLFYYCLFDFCFIVLFPMLHSEVEGRQETAALSFGPMVLRLRAETTLYPHGPKVTLLS